MYAGITAIEESRKHRRKEYLAAVRAAGADATSKSVRRRRVIPKAKKQAD
jgi:hypothetical protein